MSEFSNREAPRVHREWPGPFSEYWILASITIGAAALRLFKLTRESFWFDEGFSVSIAHSGLREIWTTVSTTEANMSLYYLVLHCWIWLGENEFIVRSFSVLAAALTIPVVYLLSKQISGQRTALIAAFLLATNTFHIQYSQEARSYTLTVFLTALSSLLLVRAVERGRAIDWLFYTLVTAMAPYSHFFAVFVIGAQWLSLLVLGFRKIPWRPFCVSAMAIVLGCMPLGVYILRDHADHLGWIPRPTWVDLYGLVGDFSGSKLRLLVLVFALAIAAAAVFAVKSWNEAGSKLKNWYFALLFAWFAVPILAVYAISQRTPLFLDKFLIICLPPFLMLAAEGMSRRLPVRFVALVLVIITVWELRSFRRYESVLAKEDWRDASAYVLSQAKDADGFVFYVREGKRTFDYYARLDRHTDEVGPVFRVDISEHKGQLDDQNGRAALQSPEKIWLIETHVWSSEFLSHAQQMRTALAVGYREISEQNFRGGIEVVEYVRR